MEKRLLRIFTLLIMMIFMMNFTACGKPSDDNHNTDPEAEEILISVYAAGYGQGWIDEACRIYEESHPEYRFKIRANARMFDTVKMELTNDTCKSDVVLLAGYDYLNIATTGKLCELTSLYESNIPDLNKKVKEVVAKEQYEYRIVGGDKIYGVPWQDTSSNGFVYNKKMFRENDWTVPETMDEFFELCDKIAEKGIAPLVYGGGQQDGYVALTPPLWLCQYYGYDYMQNTFEKYSSPQQFSDTQEGRQKAYDTLARLLKGKTANGNNIALTGSKGFTAQAAQREFIKGRAAMDICGPWFPTEMKTILKSMPDFEYGYIPTPHINADKKDINGNDTSSVNYSLAANVLCVPANAPHKDVAKDFLLSMFSSESYKTFVESNNGMTRPINVPVDTSSFNDFSKAFYNSMAKGKEKGEVVYETSLSPMSINGYLGLINFHGGDAYADIINSAGYEEALSAVSDAAASDYQTALSFWDSKNNCWDEKYIVK